VSSDARKGAALAISSDFSHAAFRDGSTRDAWGPYRKRANAAMPRATASSSRAAGRSRPNVLAKRHLTLAPPNVPATAPRIPATRPTIIPLPEIPIARPHRALVTIQPQPNIRDGVLTERFVKTVRQIGDMRCRQYVVRRPKRAIRRQRLNVEYVDRRASDLLILQDAYHLRLEAAKGHQKVLDLAGRRGFAGFQVTLNA
jgi:hypothetical protein